VSLWVKDRVSIAEGQQHMYKFSVPRVDSGNKPFKVTLTWLDPYTSATSGSPVLHNLDLSVCVCVCVCARGYEGPASCAKGWRPRGVRYAIESCSRTTSDPSSSEPRITR
jgi:hypothetical protein